MAKHAKKVDRSDTGYYSGLKGVLGQQCLGSQLSKFLQDEKKRSEKHRKTLKSTGNKPELVQQIMHEISTGLIDRESVYDLLRECEEHGRQHVFFYKPKRGTDASEICRDSSEIAVRLFGEDTDPGFPNFERKKQAHQWVDFRDKLKGKPRDWIAKAYGHERITRRKGKSEKVRVSANEFQIVMGYEEVDYSTVGLLRWNHPGLLEVRVDQKGANSEGVIPKRLDAMWDLVNDVLPRDDFVPWCLRPAITKMVVEASANTSRYECRTLGILDANEGNNLFRPKRPREPVTSDKGRTAALESLIEHGGQGDSLCVVWMPFLDDKSSEDIPKELDSAFETIVTGDNANEVVITKRISAVVFDYVTDQFRKYS